jgi:hypothetical protein
MDRRVEPDDDTGGGGGVFHPTVMPHLLRASMNTGLGWIATAGGHGLPD